MGEIRGVPGGNLMVRGRDPGGFERKLGGQVLRK